MTDLNLPAPSQREQIFAELVVLMLYAKGGKVTVPFLPEEMKGAPLTFNWEPSPDQKEITITLMRSIPYGMPTEPT